MNRPHPTPYAQSYTLRNVVPVPLPADTDLVTEGMRPLAPVRRALDVGWRQRERDAWTAAEVAARNWPADLEAAGINVSAPVFPAWHPDNCNHGVAVQSDELTLPCTLTDPHGGPVHQVWSTSGELMAEAAVEMKSTPAKTAVRRKPKVQPIAVERATDEGKDEKPEEKTA